MIDYKQRSLKKELLDGLDIPFDDIQRNMQELNFINTHLGGHAITIEGFKKLLQNKKQVCVCEIGCGGADNINALHQYCIQNNVAVSFIGIDINKDCIAYAQQHVKSQNVVFLISDYRNADLKNTRPDIIFSSLFCHHFIEEELVTMLQWMDVNSKIGFFINDLHRHPMAYHSIKILSRLFSKSYLVKNDAPLSVLRGFKKEEWQAIFRKAKISDFAIKWRWAFRYLITKPST